MTDDELVERFFPCDCGNCLTEYGGHYDWCQTQNSDAAYNLAAAVREAVMASAKVCDKCGGSGSTGTDSRPWLRDRCAHCQDGIVFGRGVVEGET